VTSTYEQVLLETAERDERVVVLTAENRAAIRSLPPKLGSRFVDVGICEQTMLGMAAGLALRGRIPVVHALAAFLTMRAFEFVRTDVGIARLPVKLVGYVPGLLSDGNGPTHQAIEDIALMRGIPHMQIFCPADLDELLAILPHVVRSPSPCYVRYIDTKSTILHGPFEPGVAEAVSDGEDVTILTYGLLVGEAVRALDILQSRGISVRLLNLRTLKPIDERAILDAARTTRFLVTLEDHFLTGGLYSIVSEILVRSGVLCSVVPMALEERWFRPGLLCDVLVNEGFAAEKIADKVAGVVRRRTRFSQEGYE
jgi:transketolase